MHGRASASPEGREIIKPKPGGRLRATQSLKAFQDSAQEQGLERPWTTSSMAIEAQHEQTSVDNTGSYIRPFVAQPQDTEGRVPAIQTFTVDDPEQAALLCGDSRTSNFRREDQNTRTPSCRTLSGKDLGP